MNLEELAAYWAGLPDRLRAERDRSEAVVAAFVARRDHDVGEIAAALGMSRQHLTRITKAARERA